MWSHAHGSPAKYRVGKRYRLLDRLSINRRSSLDMVAGTMRMGPHGGRCAGEDVDRGAGGGDGEDVPALMAMKPGGKEHPWIGDPRWRYGGAGG